MRDIPLTPEQRLFAAENHDLVYAFLNDKHLSENDFYDVIIFGYLDAVRRYFANPHLQQYSFGTVAWGGMQGTLANYKRSMHRQKRTATVISIHVPRYDDGLPLEETIESPDELMRQLETRLLLHDLARHVSRQQMDMVRLRGSGYSDRDIARKHNVSMDQVRKLLNEVRLTLKALCYE